MNFREIFKKEKIFQWEQQYFDYPNIYTQIANLISQLKNQEYSIDSMNDKLLINCNEYPNIISEDISSDFKASLNNYINHFNKEFDNHQLIFNKVLINKSIIYSFDKHRNNLKQIKKIKKAFKNSFQSLYIQINQLLKFYYTNQEAITKILFKLKKHSIMLNCKQIDTLYQDLKSYYIEKEINKTQYKLQLFKKQVNDTYDLMFFDKQNIHGIKIVKVKEHYFSNGFQFGSLIMLTIYLLYQIIIYGPIDMTLINLLQSATTSFLLFIYFLLSGLVLLIFDRQKIDYKSTLHQKEKQNLGVTYGILNTSLLFINLQFINLIYILLLYDDKEKTINNFIYFFPLLVWSLFLFFLLFPSKNQFKGKFRYYIFKLNKYAFLLKYPNFQIVFVSEQLCSMILLVRSIDSLIGYYISNDYMFVKIIPYISLSYFYSNIVFGLRLIQSCIILKKKPCQLHFYNFARFFLFFILNIMNIIRRIEKPQITDTINIVIFVIFIFLIITNVYMDYYYDWKIDQTQFQFMNRNPQEKKIKICKFFIIIFDIFFSLMFLFNIFVILISNGSRLLLYLAHFNRFYRVTSIKQIFDQVCGIIFTFNKVILTILSSKSCITMPFEKINLDSLDSDKLKIYGNHQQNLHSRHLSDDLDLYNMFENQKSKYVQNQDYIQKITRQKQDHQSQSNIKTDLEFKRDYKIQQDLLRGVRDLSENLIRRLNRS